MYAQSDAAMNQEHQRFSNGKLPYLLTGETDRILLGGDFNFILEASETTGVFTHSRALAELVLSLALTGTWHSNPKSKIYS